MKSNDRTFLPIKVALFSLRHYTEKDDRQRQQRIFTFNIQIKSSHYSLHFSTYFQWRRKEASLDLVIHPIPSPSSSSSVDGREMATSLFSLPRSARIIVGIEAIPNSWLVNINLLNGSQFCSGSLTDPLDVLTTTNSFANKTSNQI